MKRWTMLASFALVVAATAVAHAQQQDKQASDLERRVAELEAQVRELKKALQEIRGQASAGEKGDTLVIHLKHVDAGTLADVITSMLGRRADGSFKVVADPRKNALLATGTAEELEKVRALVREFDRPEAKNRLPRPIDHDVKEAVLAIRKALEHLPSGEEKEMIRKAIERLGDRNLKERLEQARAEVKMWQEKLEFSERLFKKGGIGEKELDEIRTLLRRAQEQVADLEKVLSEKKP